VSSRVQPSGSKDRQKKARKALIRFRIKAKKTLGIIEKIDDINMQIELWTGLIQDLDDILKEHGGGMPDEIRHALDTISDYSHNAGKILFPCAICGHVVRYV
jgi:hypothetical protein